MSELDALRSLGDRIVPPPFEDLRETARRQTRRAHVATSAAVAVAVIATAAAVYLGRGADSKPEPAPAPHTRPLTYADGRTIHYGSRTIRADGPVAELDVTDDGVGYRTDDGRIWFTDGSTVDPLGTLGETGPGYSGDAWPVGTPKGWMLSSNAGSRLVWFEFPTPGEPEVVVYDTATKREIVRDPVRLQPGHTAVPALLTDRFVYWFKDPDPEELPEDQAQVRYDPETREESRITEPELLHDLDTTAAVRSVKLKDDGRADSSGRFHYSDGMGQQMAVDLREGVAPVGGGDMVAEDVNGRPFAFEAPPDYTDKSGVAWLVQWLDNQTVVVLSPLRQRTDLIACHLDTRKCEVRAHVPTGVVVPDFGKSEFIG